MKGLLHITADVTSPLRAVKRLKSVVMNDAPLTKSAAKVMHRIQIKHFAEAVDSRGRAWPRRKRMKVRGKVHRLLVLTGALRGSLTPRATATGPEVFTRVKYAGVHQFGSADGTIPQREFLYLTDKEFQQVAQVYDDGFIGAWRDA
jgi:phage gpG-like protein